MGIGKLLGAFVEVSDKPKDTEAAPSPEDLDADDLLAQLEGVTKTASTPTMGPATSAPMTASGPSVFGRTFNQIYALAGVPSSPYPAERFLTLIEGLKAMPPAVAKQAVTAMDTADDTWKIDDVVTDVNAKVVALQKATADIEGQVTQVEREVMAIHTEQDGFYAEAEKVIREQIRELEAELQKQATEVATAKKAAEDRLLKTKEEAAHEKSKIAGEMARLGQITRFLQEKGEA